MDQHRQYILFYSVDGHGGTIPTILIPYDLIIQSPERVKGLELLRSFTTKNVIFECFEGQCLVDQMFIQNSTWKGNSGRQDLHPCNEIISSLEFYARGYHQSYDMRTYTPRKIYTDIEDEIWINDIIVVTGNTMVSPIEEYCELRGLTEYDGIKIDIVEGFLILRSRNGKLLCNDTITTNLKIKSANSCANRP